MIDVRSFCPVRDRGSMNPRYLEPGRQNAVRCARRASTSVADNSEALSAVNAPHLAASARGSCDPHTAHAVRNSCGASRKGLAPHLFLSRRAAPL